MTTGLVDIFLPAAIPRSLFEVGAGVTSVPIGSIVWGVSDRRLLNVFVNVLFGLKDIALRIFVT